MLGCRGVVESMEGMKKDQMAGGDIMLCGQVLIRIGASERVIITPHGVCTSISSAYGMPRNKSLKIR